MARSRRGRGEGGVAFCEERQLWIGTVSLGYDGSGKRKRRKVYGQTKQEVQGKLRALQNQVDTRTLSDSTKLTVGDLLTRWLDNTARNEVRGTTLERYDALVRVHLIPTIGKLKLSRIGWMDIEDCYNAMERAGASAWTRKMAGTLLGNALRQAVKKKLIAFNPCADVAKARPEEKEMLFLNEPQARAFLTAAEGRHGFMPCLLWPLVRGCVQGEPLGLQWSDIDFQAGTVSVVRTLATIQNKFVLKEPKSKKSRRTVSLPAFAVAALQSRIGQPPCWRREISPPCGLLHQDRPIHQQEQSDPPGLPADPESR